MSPTPFTGRPGAAHGVRLFGCVLFGDWVSQKGAPPHALVIGRRAEPHRTGDCELPLAPARGRAAAEQLPLIHVIDSPAPGHG